MSGRGDVATTGQGATTDRGPRWIRHRPDAAQRGATLRLAIGAGLGVGIAVGAAVLYFSRLFVARERIAPAPRGEEPGGVRS